MNLIEIVKSEYATIPDCYTGFRFIVQDSDGVINIFAEKPSYSHGSWNGGNSTCMGEFKLADDHHTAILHVQDINTPTSSDRLYEIQKEVRRLEGEITERIETIRELKAELAQHGFSMPFRRQRRTQR